MTGIEKEDGNDDVKEKRENDSRDTDSAVDPLDW
jgi:hypothetical protein